MVAEAGCDWTETVALDCIHTVVLVHQQDDAVAARIRLHVRAIKMNVVEQGGITLVAMGGAWKMYHCRWLELEVMSVGDVALPCEYISQRSSIILHLFLKQRISVSQPDA